MSITPPPDNPPTWGQIAQTLASLADSMAIIATYVEELRQEHSGEKTYEVGSWVLGASSEGVPLVWLYSTHPKLDKRCAVVYGERFDELPFDPLSAGARTFDGEQAPTRAGAAQRGYLVHCAPFTVALRPTGAKTDAGQTIRKFHRVVSVQPMATAAAPATPAPSSAPPPPAAAATPRGAGPRRIPADAAILAQLDARERHYLDQNFTGKTQTITYQLWLRLVTNLFGPDGRDRITARLARATLQQVESDKWLPGRARMAAMLEWLMEQSADGNPIRPYRIRPDGEGELRIVLAEAQQEFGDLA